MTYTSFTRNAQNTLTRMSNHVTLAVATTTQILIYMLNSILALAGVNEYSHHEKDNHM